MRQETGGKAGNMTELEAGASVEVEVRNRKYNHMYFGIAVVWRTTC